MGAHDPVGAGCPTFAISNRRQDRMPKDLTRGKLLLHSTSVAKEAGAIAEGLLRFRPDVIVSLLSDAVLAASVAEAFEAHRNGDDTMRTIVFIREGERVVTPTDGGERKTFRPCYRPYDKSHAGALRGKRALLLTTLLESDGERQEMIDVVCENGGQPIAFVAVFDYRDHDGRGTSSLLPRQRNHD